MKRVFIFAISIATIAVAIHEWVEHALPTAEHQATKGSTRMAQMTIFPRGTGSIGAGGGQSGPAGAAGASPVTGRTPLEVGEAYLKAHTEEWNLQPHHDFRPVEFKSPLGTHVKYSVFQDDLPVLGMEIELEIGNDLSVESVHQNYRPLPKADVSSGGVLSPDEVLARSGRFSADSGALNANRVLFVPPGGGTPVLAYVMTVRESNRPGPPVEVVFKASDGQVLHRSYARQF